MNKSDIIQKALRESNTESQPTIAERLNERVPEGDSKTCEDFKHLGVECCETCHTFMPENEMEVVDLPEGGKAWICCAVRRVAFPDAKKPADVARERLQNQLARAGESREEVPHIGIFWLKGDELVIDSVPISDALSALGSVALSTQVNVTSGRDHTEYWAELQRRGVVPKDLAHDALPRGQVSFDSPADYFWLRADQCIFDRKDVIERIMAAFKLPPDITLVGRGDGYYCARCRENMPPQDLRKTAAEF